MQPNGLEALKIDVRRRGAKRVASGRRWTVKEVLRRRAERRARRSFFIALLAGAFAAAGAIVLGLGLI
jgi:hypothetical protein